jgi:hypothetical protein
MQIIQNRRHFLAGAAAAGAALQLVKETCRPPAHIFNSRFVETQHA